MELHLPGRFTVCDHILQWLPICMMIIRARSGQLPPLEDTVFDKRSPPPIRSSAVRNYRVCTYVTRSKRLTIK